MNINVNTIISNQNAWKILTDIESRLMHLEVANTDLPHLVQRIGHKLSEAVQALILIDDLNEREDFQLQYNALKTQWRYMRDILKTNVNQREKEAA